MSVSDNIKGPIVGIDLGTTNSCIAILEGSNNFNIIVNDEGQRTTPSYVSYLANKERSVGGPAKRQSVTNPGNTIYRSKSFIGVNFDSMDSELSKNIPFELIKDSHGSVNFKLKMGTIVSPSEVGAAILQELVKSAERHLGQPVKNVVITVPAYFNNAQREATKNAGEIAGLNVVRIINEPTAAALAYGLDKIKGKENIAVYDLGGGTFDVSILSIEDGVFEVLSTNGDTQLGGEGFDSKIIDMIVRKFKAETGIEVKTPDAIQRLREAAEKAKIELSVRQEAEINLPFITADASGPKHLNVKITRSEFEKMIEGELLKTEECCKKAIQDSKLSINEINRILLVGGSTRIPKVKELVKQIFGKDPSCDLNPDEVVAMGAAVQGGILAGNVKDILLLDVTPLTLGIETLGGVLTPVIERNATIPTHKTQVFSTAADNQTSVSIRIFQGERKMAQDNKILGNFDLNGIPPAPRGVPQIEVSFDLDVNGILTVSAMEKTTGKKQDIRITGSSGLSKEEIERMAKEAEQFAEADRAKTELVELRNQSDNLIYTSEKSLRETKDLPTELKTEIEEKIKVLQEKLNGTDKAVIQSAFDDLSSNLSKIYEHISKNTNSEGAADKSSEEVKTESADEKTEEDSNNPSE